MLDKVLGDALQSVLLQSRGFAWFLYCSEALACVALALGGTPVLGLLALYPVYQLVRYEADRADSEKPPTEAESEDIRCPHCDFEQWKGYSICQRCGRTLR
jgi:hypothetical protein